jgi:hypothetical protein
VDVIYSRHASLQMRKRGISEKEVQAVLDSPQSISDTYSREGFPPRKNYWRREKGRLLRVTLAMEEPAVVVTVVAPEEEE